jgi:hypothetical protein
MFFLCVLRDSVVKSQKFLVTLPVGKHPFPFRTRQLSPPGPMVLTWLRVGRVGRCQDYMKLAGGNAGLFLFTRNRDPDRNRDR